MRIQCKFNTRNIIEHFSATENPFFTYPEIQRNCQISGDQIPGYTSYLSAMFPNKRNSW